MSSDKWFYVMVLSLVAETTKMFPQLHQGRGNIPKKPIGITNKSLKRFITSLAQNGSELGCKDLSVFSTTQRRSGFPGGAVLKNLPANAGDSGNMSSTPGSGRYPAGGNGNPVRYSCLENSKVRGAWWATVHRVSESNAIEQAQTHTEEIDTTLGLPSMAEKDKASRDLNI